MFKSVNKDRRPDTLVEKLYGEGWYVGEIFRKFRYKACPLPKPGTRKGHGTFYYFNGDRYVGKWKRDKPEGRGIYYYTNGDR